MKKKKAMDETILLVDKMENDHKKEINELKLLLNFEKDKVVMLEKSLDTERKARMEEIYKQDRQTKDFDYVSKDYEIISNLNRDMVLEFEALKNENSALGISVKSLQDNKQTLLNELKKYEEQVAELENQNTNLRKRLYETESQRDTFQIQIDKLKDKVSSLSVETLTRPGSFKKRGQSHSLTPLHGTHSLRWPNDSHSNSFHNPSQFSSKSKPRISELSTLNVIRKFNNDSQTIALSQQRTPGLWPVR